MFKMLSYSLRHCETKYKIIKIIVLYSTKDILPNVRLPYLLQPFYVLLLSF